MGKLLQLDFYTTLIANRFGFLFAVAKWPLYSDFQKCFTILLLFAWITLKIHFNDVCLFNVRKYVHGSLKL